MRPDPTTASDDGSDGSSSGSSFAGPRQPPAPRIAGAGRRTTTRMPPQNAARHLPTTPTGSKPPRSGSTAIAANTTTTNMAVETNWSNLEDEHARRYDLTPVSAVSALTAARSPGGYTVDPWEAEEEDDEAEDDDEDMDEEEERPLEATTQQARNSRRGGMPRCVARVSQTFSLRMWPEPLTCHLTFPTRRSFCYVLQQPSSE